ncbi:Down syndrome cell adhesion molecule-like protein Dscam2, partial [Gryllus bimaculatus]
MTSPVSIFSIFLIFSGAWWVALASPLLEGQGPLLEVEPAPRLEFANSTGGRLDCVARGSPQPQLKWLLADGAAAGAVPGLRQLAPNGSLLFPAFGAADFRPDVHRAVYRCQAANALGRVLSRDVKVRAAFAEKMKFLFYSSKTSRKFSLSSFPPRRG